MAGSDITPPLCGYITPPLCGDVTTGRVSSGTHHLLRAHDGVLPLPTDNASTVGSLGAGCDGTQPATKGPLHLGGADAPPHPSEPTPS